MKVTPSARQQALKDANPTGRFSNRVEFYVRSRPRYPLALLQFLQNELNLKAADVIADIGSGTGFLSELFVTNGNPTFAIEPNDEMRAAGEAHLSHYKNFHSIKGTAEATTLKDNSINFITAGQAFHWFEPVSTRKEFARILAPRGWVVLVWNERSSSESPAARAYEALIEKFQTDLNALKHRYFDNNTELTSFFHPATFQTRSFPNPQALNRRGLLDRITSASYMPIPTDPKYNEILGAANAIFDTHQHDGHIVIPHETKAFFGQINPAVSGST